MRPTYRVTVTHTNNNSNIMTMSGPNSLNIAGRVSTLLSKHEGLWFTWADGSMHFMPKAYISAIRIEREEI